MSVIDHSLDYSKYAYTHGSYQLTKIMQQTGGQTSSLTATGGQDSIFEIPAKVFNLARSNLSFTLTPTAAGGTSYNWLYADGLTMIRQLQLYTRTGIYLVDINDVDRYTNMVMRRENKLEDVLTWDKIDGVFSGLSPSNVIADANIRPNSTAVPGTAGFSGGKTNYLEPLYMVVGTSNTATPLINIQIDFDKIKNNLLGLDKDLYFNGEILNLKIVWNSNIRTLFTSTVATGALTAAASPTPAQIVNISNLTFYLAVEVNPQIENMIKATCSSAEGLQLLIPFVYYSRINLNGTSQNVTVRYNRAHGSKLQKIYWGVYNNLENSVTTYDHNNLNGAKIISFYTQIDNIRTSQFDYICTTLDDYKVKQDSLRGSSILSSNEYYYNWVWIEDFTDDNPLWKDLTVPKENCIDGLDLTNERKYDITTIAVNGNYNHYVYTVCQKLLIISPTGISLL